MTPSQTKMIHKMLSAGVVTDSHSQIRNTDGDVVVSIESWDFIYKFVFGTENDIKRDLKGLRECTALLTEWIGDAMNEKLSREKFTMDNNNNEEIKIG